MYITRAHSVDLQHKPLELGRLIVLHVNMCNTSDAITLSESEE